jgi:osmotically-inducible protein OsmY
MRQILALLLIPFLAATLALPARASNSSVPRNVPAPAHAAVSDTQLEATIRAKLAKSKIGKDGFRFRVQRGVVTWEGSTVISQHKGAATRMARSSGAAQVVNNIKVTGTGNGAAGGTLRKAYVQP